MKVSVKNFFEFQFSDPPSYGIQRLRMTPKESNRQKVLKWEMTFIGAKKEIEYFDHHGNNCILITFHRDIKTVSVLAEGMLEMKKTIGVINDENKIPIWLFKRHTNLVKPGKSIKEFCKEFTASSSTALDLIYQVAKELKQILVYKIGATNVETTAEEAFLQRTGVCQDFSHILIACMRLLNFPARYVSGYLKINDEIEQEATHAWTEVFVDNLGWVGIDVSNNIAVDENYIVLATGFDYKDAKPIHGLQFESENNTVKTLINIQQQLIK